MKPVHPNEPLAGCTVVRWSANGPEAVLRCPCGQTFPVPKAAARARHAALRCPECPPPGPDRVPDHWLLRRTPTPGTRSAKAVALMAGGMPYWEAAAAAGVCEQSGEKLYFRYVVFNRMLALEKKVAELEGRAG